MQLMHYISIAFACAENLFFSGAIYGWPTFEYVLIQDGYFSHLCPNMTNVTSLMTCTESKEMLNLVFTSATSVMVMLAPFGGYIFDRFGTWLFRSIATMFLTLGVILLAASTPETPNLLFPGAISLAIGGLHLLISNLQLGNPAGSGRATVITLVNGSFDSGTLFFLIVKLAYDSGTSLRVILSIYAACSVFPWVKTYTLMPRYSFQYPMKDPDVKFGFYELKEISCSKTPKIQDNDVFEDTDESDEQNKSLLKCLLTPVFWTSLIYTLLLHLRVIFFLGSFVDWLQAFEPVANISNLTNIFGILLCLGLFVGPINGIITDTVTSYNINRGKSVAKSKWRGLFASTFSTTLLAVSFSIAAALQNTIGTFILFILTRSFLYSSISSFIATAFPSRHLGKLYGISMALAGVFGFSTYGIFSLANSYDPKFIITNYVMIAMVAVTVVHSVLIYVKSRNA
ncbi:equilibrative nucleobase transporter 1-like [Ciona intestinalis]